VTRLFVSKRRSRAANEYSRVIPVSRSEDRDPVFVVERLFVSKRRSRAANEYSRVIPVSRSEDRDPVFVVERLFASKRRSRAANEGWRRRAQAGARRVGRGGRPQRLPSAPASVPVSANLGPSLRRGDHR
jgi:hypothetical protein